MAQDVPHAHSLPKHAQLTFAAYQGTFFPVGEVRYRLDIGDNMGYAITAEVSTAGLISFFKSFEMSQLNSGTLTDQGLRPNLYSETRNGTNGPETISAEFNWAKQTLTFFSDLATSLPNQTQDILSFIFQLSQLPLDDVALPISKMGYPEEAGLTVWLGLEYRLLPVKVRQANHNGEVTAEMLISDIRLANEQCKRESGKWRFCPHSPPLSARALLNCAPEFLT